MKYLSHFSLTFGEAKKNCFLYIKKALYFLGRRLFRKGFEEFLEEHGHVMRHGEFAITQTDVSFDDFICDGRFEIIDEVIEGC